MSQGHAKSAHRVQLGGFCALPRAGSHVGFVTSFVLALGLLAISAGAVLLVRDRAAQPPAQSAALPAVGSTSEAWSSSAEGAAPGVKLELGAPRVPTAPVETLDRVDLSAVVRNPSDRPVSKVSLELAVRQPDGTRVMTARQSGLALDAHDSRAIYWSWRVPAQLGGTYLVEVHAFDSQGQPLDNGNEKASPLEIVGRR